MFKLLCVLLLVGLVSCQSAQKKQVEQQILPSNSDQEKVLGDQLTKNLDATYGHLADERAEAIVETMLKKLKAPEGTKAHLLLTDKFVVAPGIGKTIYVSRGVLTSFKYENEMAFVLGTALSLLKDRVTALRLANLQGQEVGERISLLPTAPVTVQKDYLTSGWFNRGGLFDFGPEAYLQAEKNGVKVIYDAHFDPRGASNLLARWQASGGNAIDPLGKIMPELDIRLEIVREEVAKLSPLRDPIVKSRSFDELLARLNSKDFKQKAKKKSS